MAVTQSQINALKAVDVALASRVTVLEAQVKTLLATAPGGGGTTPVPNPPPPPTPDVTAPNVTNVVITVTGSTTAIVACVTSEAATVVVEYGTGTGYGSQTSATASGTSHSRTLSGLTAGTTYHVRIRATDTAGNLRLDADRTFTTQQVPAPPPGTSITVASISALKAALANNSYTEIVVTNGTYHCSPAGLKVGDSLWIGAAFAGRTNPVTVRAATSGSVTFELGNLFGGHITFAEGAHHQTWTGFKLANSVVSTGSDGTGAIFFGGILDAAPPHHITLNDWTILSSVVGSATPHGHGIYVSWAATPGVHDLVIDGYTMNNPGHNIISAIQLYHSAAGNPNAYNVTARNVTVTGTDQAFLIWDDTAHDIVIEDASVSGAASYAVRFEHGSAVTLRRVASSSSGSLGFYSGTAHAPTYDGCHFDGTEIVIP